jgi:hypothetical protein
MTPSGIEPATFPACSAVHQQTVSPRAPDDEYNWAKKKIIQFLF